MTRLDVQRSEDNVLCSNRLSDAAAATGPATHVPRDLEQLARLIHEHNRVCDEIASLIGRPALAGHVGEFIASRIFDIRLAASAVAKSMDGHFASGALVDRSVNIKWYAKREDILDLTVHASPDFYLVLCGPHSSAASSRAGVRPWCIESVHLFEAAALATDLGRRGVLVGTATSVRAELWRAAELHPQPICRIYSLTDQQHALLRLFSTQMP